MAKKRSRPPIYPWDKWFSRSRKFTLHAGKDYHCQQNSMCVMIRQQARFRVGVSVNVFPQPDQSIQVIVTVS